MTGHATKPRGTRADPVQYAGGMDKERKAREVRARRAAERQGFTLVKSRKRDPLAIGYGWAIMQGDQQLAHFRDLDALEHWLTSPGDR